ncbi:hypothetical protein [Halobacillus sp. BBL2006]|uniref:hypothetical protein n=1 Tax=Halobacillus sp. BBL2006 TaxID=1543706 RepID=UPI000A573DAE|nr:hypothetical protein [Halobacillus sp. BBL2006]
MRALISSILAFLVVWTAFGLIFNDFDEGILIFTIAGIITGYNIGKKQKDKF